MEEPKEFALYKAISDFQQECPVMELKSKATVQLKNGGSYEYRYASFPTILEAIKPILEKNKLGFYHIIGEETMVTCVLFHYESGEKIESKVKLPFGTDKVTAQSHGAVITYARRYTLCAILGIVAEEDNDAPPPKEKKKKKLGEDDFNLAVERITNGEQGLYEKIKKLSTLSEAQNKVLFDLSIKYETS